MSCVPNANGVGCLMYALVCTRPNILHAVDVVSKYMENMRKEHWNAVKWVFWYIRAKSDHCITFNNNNDFVFGFVDLDFVGDLDKRRSISGYVFTFAGGAISWMSKIQDTVALSTTEAEYIAAIHVNVGYKFLLLFTSDFRL